MIRHTLQKTAKSVALNILIALVCTISSCSSNIIFTDIRHMENDQWLISDTATFSTHTAKGYYNIDILVRSTERYKYQNLWLFIKTTQADSIVSVDTIQGFLSDNFGRRLGQGIGSKLTDYIRLADTIQLADTTYTFQIQHGMRTDTLCGISDIGITITQINNQTAN